MMLSAGQMNDQKGANILAPLLPKARELIADRGYDSNPFRAALAERGIAACIPPKKNRKAPIPYDKTLYRQRHRIEIAFGRLKGSGHRPEPPHRNTLRPMPHHLLRRHHPRRHPHLLAQTMSPEPRVRL